MKIHFKRECVINKKKYRPNGGLTHVHEIESGDLVTAAQLNVLRAVGAVDYEDIVPEDNDFQAVLDASIEGDIGNRKLEEELLQIRNEQLRILREKQNEAITQHREKKVTQKDTPKSIKSRRKKKKTS
jgi:hypothetical protein